MCHHHSDLDSQDTLSHHYVAHGGIDVLGGGLTSLDHVAISELLGLGTLPTDLAGDGNLSSLGSSLHYEAENAIACATYGEAAQKLVLQGLGLGLGAQSTVGDALGKDLNASDGEVESLLHHRGHLANALALLTKDILGTGGLDDDLSAGGGDADLKACISILSQLAGEKLEEEEVGKVSEGREKRG